MPTEILALIDKPHLFIAVLLIGALIGMGVERLVAELQRRAWRQKNKWRWKSGRSDGNHKSWPWSMKNGYPQPAQLDAADQLRIVMGASFSVQPVLNKSEARVFRELDRIVIDRNPKWQVMAQVSLGEILSCKDASAFKCINSKRVDLLLMDEDCQPRHAIEYQGAGHYQNTAAARDAVKREALRRAGIGYHEVISGHTTPSDLQRLVEKLVNSAVGNSTAPEPTL
ncbi:DUF2726 domain-containing protein [Aestuariivirga sp.]|uniref:DUF2726 domain-containing protein n=1 Tax=Aestuariivirga sp. TaxID=2650926 RepID=UPI0035937826